MFENSIEDLSSSKFELNECPEFMNCYFLSYNNYCITIKNYSNFH